MFILIILLSLIVLCPIVWRSFTEPHISLYSAPADSPQANSDLQTKKNKIHANPLPVSKKNKPPIKFKKFDPNHINLEEAKKLGIPERVYHNLRKYLDRGGKITSPEQFKKIYGLPEELFIQLEPYLDPGGTKDSLTLSKTSFTKRSKDIEIIDLNSADEKILDQLPGIGKVLAERIIKFRDGLGGFYHTNQLAEVYGISDSLFQTLLPFLKITKLHTKISINHMDQDELELHPYISRKQAAFIIKLRRNVGKIEHLEMLRETKYFSSDWITKMEHYFEFD